MESRERMEQMMEEQYNKGIAECKVKHNTEIEDEFIKYCQQKLKKTIFRREDGNNADH